MIWDSEESEHTHTHTSDIRSRIQEGKAPSSSGFKPGTCWQHDCITPARGRLGWQLVILDLKVPGPSDLMSPVLTHQENCASKNKIHLKTKYQVPPFWEGKRLVCYLHKVTPPGNRPGGSKAAGAGLTVQAPSRCLSHREDESWLQMLWTEHASPSLSLNHLQKSTAHCMVTEDPISALLPFPIPTWKVSLFCQKKCSRFILSQV